MHAPEDIGWVQVMVRATVGADRRLRSGPVLKEVSRRERIASSLQFPMAKKATAATKNT